MNEDVVDRVIAEWASERPDLDADCLGITGRILRLSGHLERRANEALRQFDLPIWAFDVLGALRRRSKPYAMTPTELTKSVVLSSGAMTNRIDRLEQQGLIERIPDPDDRRSLQVRLTPRGLKVVDAAAPCRFQEARDAVGDLSRRERDLLASLLRKVLRTVESENAP